MPDGWQYGEDWVMPEQNTSSDHSQGAGDGGGCCCYWRVTFELCIQFEMAIVSNHTSCYFKIFKLHLNIFPISEPTVTEPQLYYIQIMDCLHLNRLLAMGEVTEHPELTG